jgi:hypothetical protein
VLVIRGQRPLERQIRGIAHCLKPAGKRSFAGGDRSHFRLLGHLKRVVDLNSEVANCAFDLRVA